MNVALETNNDTFYKTQLAKFFDSEKGYVFRVPTDSVSSDPERKLKAFSQVQQSRIGFLVELTLAWIRGHKVTTYHLSEKEGWDRIYNLFGKANNAPRQSLTNLFKREDTALYEVTSKGKLISFKVGAWGECFHGVQVKL